ncbi:MAG: hypothetical protein RLZ10_1357 [Bacteroidota bacterium]|jgi:hypothetical protein
MIPLLVKTLNLKGPIMKKIAGLLVTIISAASFSAVAADKNTNATHDVKAPIQLSVEEMDKVVAGSAASVSTGPGAEVDVYASSSVRIDIDRRGYNNRSADVWNDNY